LKAAEIRRRLVARLRFDDLFCCDNPSDVDGSRIIVSASDVVEGPLFAFLQPDDLRGLDIEICAPNWIVSAPDPVAGLLRSWIQNEDGTGRPFILNLLPSDEDRAMVTEQVLTRRNLNICTIEDAVQVVRETGLASALSAAIREHWWNWKAILSTTGSVEGPRLAPYRQGASAAGMLKSFRESQQNSEGSSSFALSREFGLPIFDEALALLQAAGGRRDVVVAYLNRIAKITFASSDLGQLAILRSIFFHFMFRAVAKANDAIDEHSDKVGDADLWALSDNQFDTLIPAPSLADSVYTLSLPQRIIGALADLSPTEYASIRKIHRTGIAVGISEFLRTRQTGSLERSLERLAKQIVAGAQPATSVTRTMVFPSLRILLVMGGGALGGAAGQVFGQTIVGATVGAGIGKTTSELIDRFQKTIEPQISANATSWLLKRSLVRRVEEERESE
jgi:uncharacterized membrane protein